MDQAGMSYSCYDVSRLSTDRETERARERKIERERERESVNER